MSKSFIRRNVIAVFALALATPALAQDKVRFQTDWIPSGEHAMYYGGWQKGIFAKRGHRHHHHARLRLGRHRHQAGGRAASISASPTWRP